MDLFSLFLLTQENNKIQSQTNIMILKYTFNVVLNSSSVRNPSAPRMKLPSSVNKS